jgi:hypothetical protein
MPTTNDVLDPHLQKSASFHTTYGILEDKTEWMKAVSAAGVQR